MNVNKAVDLISNIITLLFDIDMDVYFRIGEDGDVSSFTINDATSRLKEYLTKSIEGSNDIKNIDYLKINVKNKKITIETRLELSNTFIGSNDANVIISGHCIDVTLFTDK